MKQPAIFYTVLLLVISYSSFGQVEISKVRDLELTILKRQDFPNFFFNSLQQNTMSQIQVLLMQFTARGDAESYYYKVDSGGREFVMVFTANSVKYDVAKSKGDFLKLPSVENEELMIREVDESVNMNTVSTYLVIKSGSRQMSCMFQNSNVEYVIGMFPELNRYREFLCLLDRKVKIVWARALDG